MDINALECERKNRKNFFHPKGASRKELKSMLSEFNNIKSTLENLLTLSCTVSRIATDYALGTVKDIYSWDIPNLYLLFDDEKYLVCDATSDIVKVYETMEEPIFKTNDKTTFIKEVVFQEELPCVDDYIAMIKYFWSVKSLSEMEERIGKSFKNVMSSMDDFIEFGQKCVELREKKNSDMTNDIMNEAMWGDLEEE